MQHDQNVVETVTGILVDALGVDEEEVELTSRIIADLGAESIDMLDISFRLEEHFDVSLPTKEWTDLFSERTGQLPAAELAEHIESDFGVRLSEEEVERYGDRALAEILDSIAEQHGVEIGPEHRRRYAELGTRELIERFSDLMLSPIEGPVREEITIAATTCGFDEDFWRAVSGAFTVERIVTFVEQRLLPEDAKVA